MPINRYLTAEGAEGRPMDRLWGHSISYRIGGERGATIHINARGSFLAGFTAMGGRPAGFH